MKALAVAVLVACGAPPAPAPTIHAEKPVVPTVRPSIGQDGPRGFEDGEPVTLAAMTAWAPELDVVEHVEHYYVITPRGVRLSKDVMNDVVPAGAVAVVDWRESYYPHVLVMGAAIDNPWGVKPGMTIREAQEHAPGLDCDRWICPVPGSRIHFIVDKINPSLPFVATNLRINRWAWNGSGRPRSAYKQPIDRWQFTAGGIGPIDGRVKIADVEKRIAPLAPGVTVRETTPVEPEISQDLGLELVRDGDAVVELLGYHASGGISQMRTRSRAFPTAAGVRVGDTLATVRQKIEQVPCAYKVDEYDKAYVLCWTDGVRYRLGVHAATQEDRDRPESTEAKGNDELVVEEIDTEVY